MALDVEMLSSPLIPRSNHMAMVAQCIYKTLRSSGQRCTFPKWQQQQYRVRQSPVDRADPRVGRDTST